MLEIPESQTITRQLNEKVKGKIIKSVAANTSPHGFAFYNGDPALYNSLLAGFSIDGAEALAGQVEMRADNRRILFNDGVNIRYFEEGDPLPMKHQMHIQFEDGASIVCTVQMYGALWAFIDGTNDNPYYLVAKEKPSPLTEAFDEAYFQNLMSSVKQNLSAKAFLATEQRIPGLGNGVLQDILFRSKIHPKRKLESLADPEKADMFRSVKETLREMTLQGGRNTEKDLFGKNGGYQTKLSNKTLNHPCPICGGTIIKQAYLGGNIYFCPNCQPIR